MAVPSPRTWVPGEVLTATLMNGHLRDPLDFLLNAPTCRLRATANQSIPTNTVTALNFDVEDADSHGGHDTVTNNHTYTVQEAGTYLLTACAPWASNSASKREVFFIINGTQTTGAATDAISANNHALGCSGMYVLAVGDTVQAGVFHNVGSNLNVDQSINGGQRLEITWMNSGLA